MSGTAGVDPGLTGALALIGPDGIEVIDMPVMAGAVDGWALASLLQTWAPDLIAVEQVHSMPKQGVASSFKFGYGYGAVHGVIAALLIPIVHAVPTVWTRTLGVGSDKDVHRRRACELWPAQAALFARKKDDGRADAALIAHWASTRERAAA